MLVKDRMTSPAITILPTMAVGEALSFMRQRNIRRLPVVDKKGHLIGIVTEKELLHASPSPATSLSIYEIGYLLSKLKVEEIMTKEIITIAPDAPVEEAARVMVDNKIGGLPVVSGDQLLGIITETDVFKTILEMMGAREQGVRITIQVVNQPGTLNKVTGAIAAIGGDIIALGLFAGDDPNNAIVTFKVCCVEKDALVAALEKINMQIVDARLC